ncbi:uncharacterized protein LOC121787902 [Salvia splendens]|uniref:uncharacterized protein LOC121787902 n=1 Tax=Salvia splendens TaxID=180675 RepID=UPI001C258A6E|nr:uncharacterized protein LOC121787902 [Salvia splendens]
MAYRRSIIARSKLFYQQHQRLSPSLSHISGRDREELAAKRNPEMLSNFVISRNNAGNSRLMRCEVPAGFRLIFHRNMLKVPLDIVVAEKAVEAAPVANEVATAASISDFDIIQFVHCYTGLEWRASFKTGGILWLTDLSGPNYVELPILVALAFWANKNLYPFQFIKGARAGEESSIHFGFALVYAVVLRKPRVQNLLGISLTKPHKAGK